jgi:hypothetical protein
MSSKRLLQLIDEMTQVLKDPAFIVGRSDLKRWLAIIDSVNDDITTARPKTESEPEPNGTLW